MELEKCMHQGKRTGLGLIECFSNHFAGPGFAIRPISLCNKPCPFLNKPNLPDRPTARTKYCMHLGEETGRIECPACSGNVKVKTFACAVHERCTLGKALDEVACCAGCLDYQTGDSPEHVSPAA